MYAAWDGQSSGATSRSGRGRSSPCCGASSSAVAGRTAPSKWQCSSAFGQARYFTAALCQRVDAWQLAVQSRVIEAVADHEPVGDDEAGEVNVDLHLASGRPVEERGQSKRRRAQSA